MHLCPSFAYLARLKQPRFRGIYPSPSCIRPIRRTPRYQPRQLHYLQHLTLQLHFHQQLRAFPRPQHSREPDFLGLASLIPVPSAHLCEQAADGFLSHTHIGDLYAA